MHEGKRVLLVEDEENVALTLGERLTREGFTVTHAAKVGDATKEILQQRFDLAILDVGLPDGSGFDIAALLRKVHRSCSIIFLTAFSDPEDRIRGLEIGAEDYIVKPFHMKELLLRIGNSLKRANYIGAESKPIQEYYKIGRAKINFKKFEIDVNGQAQALTHKECSLLKFLYENAGRVVSRDEILNFVWSEDEYPTPRTVDNFIVRLRRFIEIDANDPQYIRSVRGVGYQMNINPEVNL